MQKGIQIDEILLDGDKGGCDKIHPVADAEQKIGLVLLAEIRSAHKLSGEAHAFAV